MWIMKRFILEILLLSIAGDKKKEEKIRNIILYEFDENKEKEGTDFRFDFVSNRKNIRADSMW